VIPHQTYYHERMTDILRDVQSHVDIESPSDDKAACDRSSAFLADLFARYTDATVRWYPQAQWGDHFTAIIGSGAHHILMLGHIDTVWPIGTSLHMPFQIADDRVSGPGIYDMKCGNIQCLWALRRIVELGTPADRRYTFFANSDEETGSPSSRSIIERLASEADEVLVLEPSSGVDGGAKLRRKGVGRYRLDVQGIGSHAGATFDDGRSAILEMAHQIIDLQGVIDLSQGTTLNVGLVSGGIAVNVVAPHAAADIDLRVWTADEAERAEQHILHRPTFLEGTSVRIEGGMNRPPMEATPATRRLYEAARRIAAEEGFNLKAGESGGGSDGNFTSALGVPTLDGMGAVGGGAHADSEHVLLSTIVPRTAWLARVLAEA
jgi:glutamate carboxypeptidase